jgi:hypothetical protein
MIISLMSRRTLLASLAGALIGGAWAIGGPGAARVAVASMQGTGSPPIRQPVLPGRPSAALDAYEPGTGHWQSAALAEGRLMPDVLAVGDLLFVAGGIHASGGSSAVVDVFDAQAGTVSSLRLAQPWVCWDLRNSRRPVGQPPIVEAGGRVFFVHTDSVDVFDTSTRSWSNQPLSEERSAPSVVTVGDRLVVAGGIHADRSPSDAVDIFDGSAWTQARLSAPRSYITTAVVGDQVVLAGGLAFKELAQYGVNVTAARYSVVPVADSFDAATSAWASHPLTGESWSSDPDRPCLVAAVVGESVVLLGGYAANVYDATTRTRSSVTTKLILDTSAGVAVAGQRTVVYERGVLSDPLAIFDVGTDTWSSTEVPRRVAGVLPAYTIGGAILLLGSKLLFAAGGSLSGHATFRASDTYDVLDIPSGTWTSGHMPSGTWTSGHMPSGTWTPTNLPEGSGFVHGRVVANDRAILFDYRNAISYTPQSDAWSIQQLPTEIGDEPHVTVLGDTVLVCAGWRLVSGSGGEQGFTMAQRYPDAVVVGDPLANAWTTATLSQPRRLPRLGTSESHIFVVGGLEAR